ncbi:MAG TPA: hypothetical protein VFZ65_10750 [Planctomycetota bacterium]|nr:hypothetical protein [Planctomycetota bacterium]
MRWVPVLVVVGIVALLAGGSLLWSDGDPAPPAPIDAPADAGRDAGEATNATASVPWPDAEADADAAPAEPGGESSDRRLVLPEAELRAAPHVRVVRGDPPAPVADATVYFVTEPVAEQHLREPRTPASRFEWPAAWGQRTATDAEGTARLPATRTPWLVAAVCDGEFAFGVVPPGPRTVTLELQGDETVTVLAEDAEQRPGAGLPVALLQHRGRGDANTIWQGPTGADGRAIVRHFQLLRQSPRGPDGAEAFAAVLLAPCPEPVVAPFEGRPAAAEPVRLVVPSLGSVDVRLTDHRGTPLLSPAYIACTVDGAAEPSEPFAIAKTLLSRHQAKPVGADPVHLSAIGAGTQLHFYARFQGDRRMAEVAAGPGRAGGTVAVDLPLAPHQLVLAGRLHWADGSPVANTNLPADLWRADRDVLGITVHTIGDGRFDLVLAARDDATEYWLELRQTVPAAAGDATALPRELGARAYVQALVGGARHELGTLVLAELPPLVAGTVADDRGEPVADAQVRVQQREVHRERNRERESWRNLPQLATRTAADGSFVLAGRMPPGTLRVEADTGQHFAASVPLQTQGQQVRIRIERNGVLRGRAVLPTWIADGSVSLALRPFDETEREANTRQIELQRRRGGRFVVQPLHAGRYDAVVTVRNLRDPVLVVPDVFVQPGETHDARLDQLDLTQSVFRHRLRAVDAAGQPLAINSPILARLRAFDGSVSEAGFRWQRGRAELVSGSAMLDIVAFAPGCAPQQLTFGPGDHDVYMPQLSPALIELPGARALCGPTRAVRISVIMEGDTGHPQSLIGVDQRSGDRFSFARWDLGKSSGAWLGHGDVVEVPLMHDGRYQVVLRLHATDSERTPQASIPLGTYELHTDGSSYAPVRVPVDPAAVAAAIAQVEGRLQQQLEQQAQRENGNRGAR